MSALALQIYVNFCKSILSSKLKVRLKGNNLNDIL